MPDANEDIKDKGIDSSSESNSEEEESKEEKLMSLQKTKQLINKSF